MDRAKGIVYLEFTKNESLILFEWLSHFDGKGCIPTRDDAEQQVLWSLEGKLEKALIEIISPDYKKCVEDAKRMYLARSGDTLLDSGETRREGPGESGQEPRGKEGDKKDGAK